MKTISKIKYVVLVAITLLAFSCSPEDGADGMNGLQGEQGIQGSAGQDGADGQDGTNGTDGQDGENGQDGTDGQDGADGQNGADGNANVQVITKDISTVAGTFEDVPVSQLTQDVIDNDVVLGYLKASNNDLRWYPLPSVDAAGLPFNVSVFISINFYSLDFRSRQTNNATYSVTAGELDTLKVVIIESTSSTTGKKVSKESVYNKLKSAGIDINDYYAVCDYLGLEY